jgi:YbbR domain-containing protein
VKQADEELTLPSIPVWCTPAPGLELKYNLPPLYDQTLTSVTVVGPRDQIQKIKDGKERVKATFEVSEEKIAPGSEKQKAEVKYDLPEGVKVKVKPDELARTIEYTLTPRE